MMLDFIITRLETLDLALLDAVSFQFVIFMIISVTNCL